MNGFFITLEGIDGSGKTTQCQLLQKHLQAANIPHICIREPGSTSLGEMLRTIISDPQAEIHPIAESYLYATCRAQLTAQVIQPALGQGKIVVCDRFLDSSIVYQGAARNLGDRTVQEINKHATFGLVPDITFLIDVPVSVSLNRIDAKKKDRIEMEETHFHEAVRHGYKKLAKEHKRIVVIDGTQSIDNIHNEILEAIKKERSLT